MADPAGDHVEVVPDQARWLMLVIGATGCLAWLITVEQVAASCGLGPAVAHQQWLFLLMLNVCLILVGIFIEPLPAMLLTIPLFCR